MFKAALFDLDGVIVDSESSYTRFWDMLGREYGCPETFAYDIKGTTLTDILNKYFPEAKTQEEVKRKIYGYEQEMEYPLFDGVERFINDLRNSGIKTALVTSSDDTKMSFLTKKQPNILSLFDTVITGSMVTNSKPDPEGYLLAAHKVGADIRECAVFEDSLQGIEAGLRAGATVFGVATTNPYEVIKEKAHEVITDFTGFGIENFRNINKP